MISFPLFVVDQEATLEAGAEGGTAEAAAEAGAVPPAVTKVIGERGPALLCGLHPACFSRPVIAEGQSSLFQRAVRFLLAVLRRGSSQNGERGAVEIFQSDPGTTTSSSSSPRLTVHLP